MRIFCSRDVTIEGEDVKVIGKHNRKLVQEALEIQDNILKLYPSVNDVEQLKMLVNKEFKEIKEFSIEKYENGDYKGIDVKAHNNDSAMVQKTREQEDMISYHTLKLAKVTINAGPVVVIVKGMVELEDTIIIDKDGQEYIKENVYVLPKEKHGKMFIGDAVIGMEHLAVVSKSMDDSKYTNINVIERGLEKIRSYKKLYDEYYQAATQTSSGCHKEEVGKEAEYKGFIN